MLNVSRITAGYGGHKVIKGVSLNVPEGALITIIGPNGHGKTTLLRCISGIVPIDDGRIVFDGKQIDGSRVDEIVKLGMVHIPQGDLLYPDMTVDDNLLMGGYLIKSVTQLEDRREKVLDLFPTLSERKKQIASTLSGGERRMLAMGRGLMTGAKILLLDEPSLGLAPVVIEKIFETIRKLNKDGQTILLIEENVSRAISVSDHIYLLDEGQIAWEGSGHDLSGNEQLMEVFLGG
jgi:branched-chain amino acid transport system ATP-binding protein